jgi:hypothetical protein
MDALRMTGRELYPAKPELANKHYFACRNCDAWIGCKDGTWEPVGRLADADLRRAKQSVHAAVEPILTSVMSTHNLTKSQARAAIYRWIATELDIADGNANIGDFDLKQCEIVLLICDHRKPEIDLRSSSHGRFSRNATSRNRPYVDGRYRDRPSK